MRILAYLLLICLAFTISCKTNKNETKEKKTESFPVENIKEQLKNEAIAIKAFKEKYPESHLYFYDNGLVQAVTIKSYNLDSLPIELRSFRHLNDLSVMNNRLKTLPNWLPELSHLELLFLGQNNFKKIPPILNLCESLKVISLSETPIKRFELDSVLPKLEGIGLVSCPLETFPVIPQTKDSPPLSITLSKTPLKAIPKEIGSMRLNELIIKDNQLEYIAPEIGMLKDLEKLDLSGSPKLNAQFPETIGNCTKLTDLTLNWCGLQEFPMFITKLVNMEFLILDNNLIEEIPSGIGNLHRLYYFRMKENKLTTLPKELNQLPRLWYLGLEYNNISEFPTEMFDIKRDTLCVLVLDGNPVRGIPVSEEQFHKGYKMFGEKQ